MTGSSLKLFLMQTMEQWQIIDCHEHLRPERSRLETPVDVFTFFSHYTRGDLAAAGMSEEQYRSLFNQDLPLDTRWRTFAPFWERIRRTSYSRAALISAAHFYGVDDIDEHAYVALSEAIRANNTPGLYQRVLGDACRIRLSLTQCGSTDLGSPLLVPVMPLAYKMDTWADLAHPPFEPEAGVRSLDDYLDAVRRYVLRVKGEGAVGLKMMANPFGPPDRAQALGLFDSLRVGSIERLPELNALRDYVIDETIGFAARQDLVVAVHTGYWGDFRKLDPLHMIPLLQRHPQARFDIYHLGYPWMRETLMLGKGFPNVWLNLAWTHIISQRFATTGLDEAIDLLPANKVLAFGGDYNVPVEKVYGHLVMAREDIAEALARRIEDGVMTESQALDLAHRWFWENPVELYRLNV